jgi:pyruvate/2-oxoglutarate dehydrogenase complex dihydrolipoamide dehydrogenase (E3) component
LLPDADRRSADSGLEAAGIRYDSSGIVVNRKLKTSNPAGLRDRRLRGRAHAAYARPIITPVWSFETRCSVFRRVNNSAVPWATYTEPELAHTGLTEAQWKSRRLRIRIARWPYNDNDRAQAERDTRGHIKVITTRKGKIVGVTIVERRQAN